MCHRWDGKVTRQGARNQHCKMMTEGGRGKADGRIWQLWNPTDQKECATDHEEQEAVWPRESHKNVGTQVLLQTLINPRFPLSYHWDSLPIVGAATYGPTYQTAPGTVLWQMTWLGATSWTRDEELSMWLCKECHLGQCLTSSLKITLAPTRCNNQHTLVCVPADCGMHAHTQCLKTTPPPFLISSTN